MNAKPGGRLVAAAAVLTVVLGACGSGSTGTRTGPSASPTSASPTSSSPSATTTPAGPSQSAADATRDGVIPELAALPFAVRVGIQRAVTTPEGVWVLSRPTAAAKAYADGCRLGPETGKYPTTTICTTEYGEVLLLDATRTRILRAYPLPAVPPTFLLVTPDAVWCGRQGDTRLSETTLPDSMVCRIDRRTFAARVRVFAPGAESEVLQPCFFPPRNWTVSKGRLRMTALQVDAHGVWAGSSDNRWTKLDRRTLAILARDVAR